MNSCIMNTIDSEKYDEQYKIVVIGDSSDYI